MLTNTLIILALIGTAFLFIYFLLPYLRLKIGTEKTIKGLIFFGMMAYLTYDFLRQEKYAYLIALFLGSVAFLYMLIKSKHKN